MRQSFVVQRVHLLERWLCDVQLGIAVKKNRALSVDQYWLQALQFLVHLIDFLSILLRCNGFTGIQKAVVDQIDSRSPKSSHDFFAASLALGSALELLLSPTTELVITHCHIQSTFVACHNPIEKWFIVVAKNKRR